MTEHDTMGMLIDNLFLLKEEKRKLEARVSTLNAQIKAKEQDLLDKFEAEGIEGSRGTQATASRSKIIVPKAENWNEIWPFIVNGPNRGEDRTFLIQKRLSAPACRELFEQGRVIPGVVPVELVKLNFRRAT